MRLQRRLLFVAVPAALLVAAVALAFWSAERALTRSATAAKTEHQLRFTLHPFDPTVLAQENPGFEPVAAPNSFTSGATLDGTLYLAGPAGLSIYAADGTLQHTLRTGLVLPVAPITALSAARLRGASDNQILIATAGAGLLLLDPHPHAPPTLHQLQLETPEARDLTCLLPLASGELLLGTRNAGVLLYDGATVTPVAPEARQITVLAAINSTAIAVATRNAGLFYLHAGTLDHVTAATGLPDDHIEALAAGNGKLFAGTPLGVAQFDLSAPTFHPERILAPGRFAHSLRAGNGDLLIGTIDQGIQDIPLASDLRLHNVALTISNPAQRIDSFLSSTLALADGTLLTRTSTGWRDALPAPSTTLADPNISALTFAPDGTLYIGFFDHGLDQLAPSGAIRHLEDDSLFCINRLTLDPTRQTIAAATANGLVLFDRQGTPRQTLTRRDGLISEHVTDLAFTRTGMTLATPAGLTFVSSTGTESLYAFQGLVNNHVYTLATGADDHLLGGTLGGISILQANSVQRNLTAANSGLKHNWITALAPAPTGGWLVGTYGAGLATLSEDASHFTPIELPANTPRDLVINPNALLVTPTHIVAGTLGHGMLVLDTRTSQWSVVTRGLPSLNVTAFAARDGQLYVGTENGLVRIAEAKLP